MSLQEVWTQETAWSPGIQGRAQITLGGPRRNDPSGVWPGESPQEKGTCLCMILNSELPYNEKNKISVLEDTSVCTVLSHKFPKQLPVAYVLEAGRLAYWDQYFHTNHVPQSPHRFCAVSPLVLTASSPGYPHVLLLTALEGTDLQGVLRHISCPGPSWPLYLPSLGFRRALLYICVAQLIRYHCQSLLRVDRSLIWFHFPPFSWHHLSK